MHNIPIVLPEDAIYVTLMIAGRMSAFKLVLYSSQEQLIVEIKPEAQITKPEPPKTNSKKAIDGYKFLAEQYVTNRDKYISAKKYAEDRGCRFVVMTENSLK